MAGKPPTETCCCGCGVLIGVALTAGIWFLVTYARF